MNVTNISLLEHVEIVNGMPAQVPYLHVNGVKLCQLEPCEVDTVIRVLRRATDHAKLKGSTVKFQAAPGF